MKCFYFRRDLGRSFGLTLVHVASCEVQLGSAQIAWKEKHGAKHSVIPFVHV